jgi:hypothetical protein
MQFKKARTWFVMSCSISRMVSWSWYVSLASWKKEQSIKICTKLSGESQCAYIGASSPHSKNPWVRRVWTLLLFWVLTPCRHVGRYHPFGETYCLHLQGLITFSHKYFTSIMPEKQHVTLSRSPCGELPLQTNKNNNKSHWDIYFINRPSLLLL